MEQALLDTYQLILTGIAVWLGLFAFSLSVIVAIGVRAYRERITNYNKRQTKLI